MAPVIAFAIILILCGAALSLRSSGFAFLRSVSRLRAQGKPGEAAALLEEAIAKGWANPWLVNLAVESLITAGKYLEALALPPAVAGTAGGDRANLALIQINLAEAEYNLGRWEAAWVRLLLLDESASQFEITRAGLALQRAWILAHTNRAAEALSFWEQADLHGLPVPYRAEHYFAHAAILVALGNLDDAEDAARAGADAAVRPSSVRNALFILARVAAARGDWARAESLCREAAAHFYQGQGGGGLVLWGDALVKLGREDEARHAWELSISRDGQSESARAAAGRLRKLANDTAAPVGT